MNRKWQKKMTAHELSKGWSGRMKVGTEYRVGRNAKQKRKKRNQQNENLFSEVSDYEQT